MVDFGDDEDIVSLLIHEPERRLLVAAADGRGFVVEEKDVMAQTRNGKQILNLSADTQARVCCPVEGDSVAVIGENRKLLVFPVSELPVMARGRGVQLQKYKDGGLSDSKTFDKADGLSWRLGDRVRTEADIRPWQGKRAQAGRLAPRGFSKDNKFS